MKTFSIFVFKATMHIVLQLGYAGIPAHEASAQDVFPSKGIIVIANEKGSALEKAGIKSGDVLTLWTDKHGSSEFRSPFDWFALEAEHAPHGEIRLNVESAGSIKEVFIPNGKWDSHISPAMSSDLVSSYISDRNLASEGYIEQAVESWAQLRRLAKEHKRSDISCWLSIETGKLWTSRREWDKAHEQLEVALKEAEIPLYRIAVLLAFGDLYKKKGNFSQATSQYQEAMKIAKENLGEGMLHAKIIHEVASLARRTGDLAASEAYSLDALKIQEHEAYTSIPTALTLNNLAIISQNQGNLQVAKDYGQKALKIIKEVAPESSENAQVLHTLGTISYFSGDLAQSEDYHKASLRLRIANNSDPSDIAGNLHNLGLVAHGRRDLSTAEHFYEEALEHFKKGDSNNLAMAVTLGNLGAIARQKHNPEIALKFYSEALEIQSQLAPNSLDISRTLAGIGAILGEKGDLTAQTEYTERALKIIRAIAPKSNSAAHTLHNLGVLAYRRGDLELAKDYYSQSLTLLKNSDPNSMAVATNLNNLGVIAKLQYHPELAIEYYTEALKIAQKRGNDDGNEVASALLNIGDLAYQNGQLNLAEEYLSRSLKIKEQIAPRSAGAAIALHNLGNVAADRGSVAQAEDFHQRALLIAQELAPDSMHVASGLYSLGTHSARRSDLDRALDYFRRSLEITTRLAPGSLYHALSLYQVAKTLYDQGRLEESLEYALRSADSLESQITKLSDAQSPKGSLRLDYRGIYSGLITLLLETNRPEEAFNALERYRARGFIEMLAERDLNLGQEVPKELDRQRSKLAAEYDQIQKALANPKISHDSSKIDELARTLRKLRTEYEEVVLKITQSSPNYAALRYPKTVDLCEARTALAPDTTMLSYFVTTTHTILFALNRDSLAVHFIDIDSELLAKEIDLFRRMIQETRNPKPAGTHRYEALVKISQKLYSRLISPANTLLEASSRIVIIPDGPLHRLPFGSLARSTKSRGDQELEYMAEWKPIHISMSSTVYSHLKASKNLSTVRATSTLAAFGDPIQPKLPADPTVHAFDDVRIRSVIERGFDFPPLPYARGEVEKIIGLFPARARSFVGAEATEASAKSIPQDTHYVHFATHATLDERFPLNSAVVLSVPEKFEEGQDNGLLQAWEIFESVRFDADLVVLSACETGLGKEMGGEGLIGLTRAFQYAGARSVLASLWKISDRTTAELMVRFYRHLKEGKPKDEALRAAQMELIRGPIQVTNEKGEVEEIDASAPYYWAAFQIYGDWQ